MQTTTIIKEFIVNTITYQYGDSTYNRSEVVKAGLNKRKDLKLESQKTQVAVLPELPSYPAPGQISKNALSNLMASNNIPPLARKIMLPPKSAQCYISNLYCLNMLIDDGTISDANKVSEDEHHTMYTLWGKTRGVVSDIAEISTFPDSEYIGYNGDRAMPILYINNPETKSKEDVIVAHTDVMPAEFPYYQPTMVANPYDTGLKNFFMTRAESGQWPVSLNTPDVDPALRFTALYEQFHEVATTHASGTGSFELQMGRLIKVMQATNFAKAERRPRREYEGYMNRNYPLVMVHNDFDFSSLDTNDWERHELLSDRPTPWSYLADADAGPITLHKGKMLKCGVTVLLNSALAMFTLMSIRTGDVARMPWLGICVDKPKEEVREISKKAVRNIGVYNNGVMRPANAFDRCFSRQMEWDGRCTVISGESVFKGGMNKLIRSMHAYAIQHGTAFAVYADNLYIITRVEGVLYWVSTDGSKFESCVRADLIRSEMRRMISVFKKSGSKMSAELETYLIKWFPHWATEGVHLMGDYQFKPNYMGSGVPGTFHWNTCLMLRVKEFLEQITALFVKRQDSIVWSPGAEQAIGLAGANLTVESFFVMPDDLDEWSTRQEFDMLPLDLLGFDGRVIQTTVGPRIVPMLQRNRMLKSLLFSSRSSDLQDGEVETGPYVANLSKIISLYSLGGFLYDDIGPLLTQMFYAWRRSFRAHIINKQDVSMKEFLRLLHESTADDSMVGSVASLIMRDFMQTLALPTHYQLYTLLVGEEGRNQYVQNLLASRAVPYTEVIPPELYQEYGYPVKLKPDLAQISAEQFQEMLSEQKSANRIFSTAYLFNHLATTDIPDVPIPDMATSNATIPKFEVKKKAEIPLDAGRLEAVLGKLRVLRQKGIKIAAYVPVPNNYRTHTQMRSIKDKRGVMMATVFRDLARFFQLPFSQTGKEFKTLAADIFYPSLLLWDNRGKALSLGDFQALIRGDLEVEAGMYSVTSPWRYSHAIWLVEGSCFDPRVDFKMYEKLGFDRTTLAQALRADLDIIDFDRFAAQRPLPNVVAQKQQKVYSKRPIVQQKQRESRNAISEQPVARNKKQSKPEEAKAPPQAEPYVLGSLWKRMMSRYFANQKYDEMVKAIMLASGTPRLNTFMRKLDDATAMLIEMMKLKPDERPRKKQIMRDLDFIMAMGSYQPMMLLMMFPLDKMFEQDYPEQAIDYRADLFKNNLTRFLSDRNEDWVKMAANTKLITDDRGDALRPDTVAVIKRLFPHVTFEPG